MAFQDSAGISVGEVEASNLTVEAASASTDPILTTQAISGASTITGLQVTAAGAVTMSQNLDLTGDEKAIKFHSWESGNQIERALIKADGDPSGAGFGGSLVIQTSDDGTFAERMRVDPQGRVGIGTSSPGGYHSFADDLVVGDAIDHRGITIASGSASTGYIFFADGTGASATRGRVAYDHSTDTLKFGTSGTERWSINSTGNLVAGANLGIDFGSAASGSGTPITNGGLLDDYEAGTFTPVVADAASGGNTGSAATAAGEYTKVGRIVHFSLRLENIDTTGLTAGNTLHIRGLPFASINATPISTCAVRTDRVSFADGIVGSVSANTNATYLTSIRSGLSDLVVPVSDYVTGIADVYMSGSYIAA